MAYLSGTTARFRINGLPCQFKTVRFRDGDTGADVMMSEHNAYAADIPTCNALLVTLTQASLDTAAYAFAAPLNLRTNQYVNFEYLPEGYAGPVACSGTARVASMDFSADVTMGGLQPFTCELHSFGTFVRAGGL